MSRAENTKQERIHIRLDALSKQKLERAAAYTQKSLSEFVLSQAMDAANEVIHEQETLTLNQADWEVFLDALESPPAPNARLRQAIDQHKQRVKS
ncbi:MAG: DUF1778 domain-containing protein [Thiohalomonadales bacterium]